MTDRLGRSLQGYGRALEPGGAEPEAALETVEEDSEEIDRQFSVMGGGKKEAPLQRLPPEREPPVWADKNAPNCRGRVDPGPRHYLVLITVNGAPVEGIVDTGACRTMMDMNTARALGLLMDERDGRRAPFGRFFGPDGFPRPYEGRSRGSVTF